METATTGHQRASYALTHHLDEYINAGAVEPDMHQRVRAVGHEHVTAEHTSTFELTSDDWLTPAGDCILGVESSEVPATFDDDFVSACRSRDAKITVRLRVDDLQQVIEGRGHPDLTFESERSMVVRTSEYVDDRTVVIDASAAAADVDRDIVDRLKAGADLDCLLRVEG